jgi:CxxC motif-containing protein (DUF1111 family)
MRLLDQPQPAPSTPSTVHGQQVFGKIGCALCHTPSFTTGQSTVTALSNVQANLFSDLLLHHMGRSLPTASVKAGPAVTNSAPRRSGVWASASTFSTMAELQTC